MTLLSLDDPVFVIDLSPEEMRCCLDELQGKPGGDAGPPSANPPAPDRPLAAVALVLDRREDPVLLSIEPTRDTAMLDGLARLLRMALLHHRSVAELATEHGDASLRRMYDTAAFPSFVYEGFDPRAAATARIPDTLRRAVGRRP